MKTVYNFIYLLLPLYVGCGMGVQSEDLDTVNINTTTSPNTSTLYEENDSSNYYKEKASETSNAKPTSIITEKQPNAVTSKQNDVKKFTEEEMLILQRTFSKDKSQASSDSNESAPVGVAKTNSNAPGVKTVKELKSRQNNNTTVINTTKNATADNKKQNDVKSFTKEEMQVMQRAFSKDKSQASSDSNKTTPLAVAKTNIKATGVAAAREAQSKQNDKKLAINTRSNTTTSSSAPAPAKENKTKIAVTNESKSSVSKQNSKKNNISTSEKSSPKLNPKNTLVPEKGKTNYPKTSEKPKVVPAINSKDEQVKGTPETNKKSGTVTENIKISNTSIVETKGKRQSATGIEQIKISVLNLKESYPTNISHTLIIEIENSENSTSNLKLTAELPRNWNLISISDLGVLEANQKKKWY